MQSITTRYYGPTDARSARVTATCQAKRITVSYDHGLGVEGNHHAAAYELANTLGWSGEWVAGQKPDGEGNVYVCLANNPPAFSIR